MGFVCPRGVVSDLLCALQRFLRQIELLGRVEGQVREPVVKGQRNDAVETPSVQGDSWACVQRSRPGPGKWGRDTAKSEARCFTPPC